VNPSSQVFRYTYFRPFLFAGFLLLALISSRILSSPDLGWHIRAGERIVEEGAIPDSDNFTHTVNGDQWWVNQPLAELLFYTVFEKLGGYKGRGGEGLILLRFLIVATLFAVLFRSGRLGGGRSELVTGIVLLLALIASASHMLLRPFLISALFLGITGLIAEGYRRQGADRLWLLPVLFAIWVHVHPGFLYGTALLGAYCMGELVRWRVGAVRGDVKPLGWNKLKRFILFSLASVAAALISGALVNPSGLEAILLPIGLMKTRFFFEVLSEFQKADFWRDRFFTALLILVAASLIPRRRRDATEIFAIVIFGFFASQAVRVILPFAVVAAPIAIRNLSPLGERFLPDRSAMGRGLRVAATVGVLFYTSWWWRHDPLRIPLPQERWRTIESFAWAPSTYPVKAYQFLKSNNLPGEVFHPDMYGGSFIWYFYPERKNFVDGRVEVFGEEFWQNDYFRILGGGPGWENMLRQYKVNTLFLRQGSAGGSDRINTLVPAMNEWALVYFDDEVVIYVRRNSLPEKRLAYMELNAVDSYGTATITSYEGELQARSAAGVMTGFASVRGLLLRSQVLTERDQWEKIADFTDHTLDARGYGDDRRVLRMVRAEARFRTGDREGARSDWEKAGDQFPSRSNLALLDWLNGGEPLDIGGSAPDRADEMARLAGLLRGAGEYERAAELLREAIRTGGGDGFYRNSLAWTLLEGGIGVEEALREAGEAVRLSPDDGYARGTLGRALLAAGDVEGAEAEMRKSIELLPAEGYRTGAKERANLALLLSGRGDPEDDDEITSLACQALLLDFETENHGKLAGLVMGRGGEARLEEILDRITDIRMQLEKLHSYMRTDRSCVKDGVRDDLFKDNS